MKSSLISSSKFWPFIGMKNKTQEFSSAALLKWVINTGFSGDQTSTIKTSLAADFSLAKWQTSTNEGIVNWNRRFYRASSNRGAVRETSTFLSVEVMNRWCTWFSFLVFWTGYGFWLLKHGVLCFQVHSSRDVILLKMPPCFIREAVAMTLLL